MSEETTETEKGSKRKSSKRGEQKVLEAGGEPIVPQEKRIKALTDKAVEYKTKQRERMKAGREERDLKVALIALMGKHALTHYRDPDEDVEVDISQPEPKVKVKLGEDEGAEPEEPEGD